MAFEEVERENERKKNNKLKVKVYGNKSHLIKTKNKRPTEKLNLVEIK